MKQSYNVVVIVIVGFFLFTYMTFMEYSNISHNNRIKELKKEIASVNVKTKDINAKKETLTSTLDSDTKELDTLKNNLTTAQNDLTAAQAKLESLK